MVEECAPRSPASGRKPTSERVGDGVICERRKLPGNVIPAKAGIQPVGGLFPMTCGVDSRLRGNDRRFERCSMPNDTTTQFTSFLEGFFRILLYSVSQFQGEPPHPRAPETCPRENGERGPMASRLRGNDMQATLAGAEL